MIVNIDNELVRLNREDAPGYMPFVVTIWRTNKSRNPIVVRRKTLHEAIVFAEEATGWTATRWVTDGLPGQICAFDGPDRKRYLDIKQYRPAELPKDKP